MHGSLLRVFAPFCGLGLSSLALSSLMIPSASAQDAAGLPTQIAPTNPNVRYVGRFDTQNPDGPRCSLPASEVRLRFQGTALNARIKEAGEDRRQVIVDGTPTSTIQLKNGAWLYNVASNLSPGQHTVALVKRTEGFVGTPQFLGFQLEQGGRLLSLPARPGHRLEVIGDSISCGYGNEGKNQNERFSPTTENAYMTYGAIAARTLGAYGMVGAEAGKSPLASLNTVVQRSDKRRFLLFVFGNSALQDGIVADVVFCVCETLPMHWFKRDF